MDYELRKDELCCSGLFLCIEGNVVLSLIVNNFPVKENYLAGDTALALLIGHRESIEFDWLLVVDFDPEVLASKFYRLGDHKINEAIYVQITSFLGGNKRIFEE